MRRILAGVVAVVLVATVCFFNGQRGQSNETTLLVATTPVEDQLQHDSGGHPESPPRSVRPAAEPTASVVDEFGSNSAESAASDSAISSLTVRVSGLEPEGAVLVAVFAEATGFPRRDATRTVSVPVTDKTANVKIDKLPEGDYAVAIFQDLNDDGVLNRGAFGIPSEPYGFSNNVRGSLGPPSFQAASFKLARGSKDLDVTVK